MIYPIFFIKLFHNWLHTGDWMIASYPSSEFMVDTMITITTLFFFIVIMTSGWGRVIGGFFALLERKLTGGANDFNIELFRNKDDEVKK